MIFRDRIIPWRQNFDPGTIAIASMAMTAIGTGVSMLGQGQQANAQAGQAQYMAQVARNNAMVMENNAKLAEQQGSIDVEKQQQKTSLVIGAQKAALAAQGGDVNSGSSADIIGDTARAGFTDAATLKSNAAYKAYGYRVQGAGLTAQAGLYDMAGANAMAALPYGIGSSLLGGASSIAGKWSDYARTSGRGGGDSILNFGGTAP